jgi:alpha-galactosidase
LSLLRNDEVLAIDQDPLGKQALRISQNGDLEIRAKYLEDSSKAVGSFNRSELGASVELKWSDLGISGKYRVRVFGGKKIRAIFQIHSKPKFRGTVSC